MIRWIAILFLSVLGSSCAQLQHLDEALRLKEYSQEADAREAMVKDQQARFRALAERILRGDPLDDLKAGGDLLSSLGDPVLIEPGKLAGQERWLYRDPVKYFDTPKVYFILDPRGKVLLWMAVGLEELPLS